VTWEDYPLVQTMGVAWDPEDGVAWQLEPVTPPGWVQLADTAPPPPPVPSLGTGIAVTAGQPISGPAGWYIVTTSVSDVGYSQLLQSTGTTNSPWTGTAYPLTVA
jgi:hypothetical protein